LSLKANTRKDAPNKAKMAQYNGKKMYIKITRTHENTKLDKLVFLVTRNVSNKTGKK